MHAPGPTLQLPRAGRAVKGLLAANVATYVVYLIMLRAGLEGVAGALPLQVDRLARGELWQLVTAGLLHDPQNPGHLLMNLLWLWVFGPQLERMTGPRGLLGVYGMSLLGGTLFTALLGGAALLIPGLPLLGGVAASAHLGASGAVLGVVMSWAARMGHARMNLLFLGELSARTFALIVLGVQLLSLLSFGADSWSMHLGGMGVGWALGRRGWPGPPRAAGRPPAPPRPRFEVIEGEGLGTGRRGRGWTGPGGAGPTVH